MHTIRCCWAGKGCWTSDLQKPHPSTNPKKCLLPSSMFAVLLGVKVHEQAAFNTH